MNEIIIFIIILLEGLDVGNEFLIKLEFCNYNL